MMKKKFIDQYHWIEEDEMLDLIAIAQSSPGALQKVKMNPTAVMLIAGAIKVGLSILV